MRHATCAAFALIALAATYTAATATENPATLADQVREAESAFAASMAARDVDAFAGFVSEEAVFFGGAKSLRGRDAVVAAWQRFFEGDTAPFSWAPETVEVLDSGTLAHSSGPVRAPDGQVVGTFNSIWRREADGRWRVVFDKGCEVCACATTE